MPSIQPNNIGGVENGIEDALLNKAADLWVERNNPHGGAIPINHWHDRDWSPANDEDRRKCCGRLITGQHLTWWLKHARTTSHISRIYCLTNEQAKQLRDIINEPGVFSKVSPTLENP